jgi:hypothetical protein
LDQQVHKVKLVQQDLTVQQELLVLQAQQAQQVLPQQSQAQQAHKVRLVQQEQQEQQVLPQQSQAQQAQLELPVRKV